MKYTCKKWVEPLKYKGIVASFYVREKGEFMKNRIRCCFLWVMILCLGGCGPDSDDYVLVSEGTVSETEEMQETQINRGEPEALESDTEDGGTIVIYICGEVANPGVYELKHGSRVCDAVELAGGLTGRASREYWNLAELLSDGQMLYFPTTEEAKERMQAMEQHEVLPRTEESFAKVRINVASSEELERIPGVGPSRAEAIIAYRNEHGRFQNVEEIMQVSGIGVTLFDRMRDYITVD